jgi:mRNA-degrading endonuclease RelE of RelBE toxin-antitoxin system
MQVVLDRNAARQLARLNEPLKSRIIGALQKLGNEPPGGDIKRLEGSAFYRARAADFRIVFTVGAEICVHKIESRGQVYKGKGKHK